MSGRISIGCLILCGFMIGGCHANRPMRAERTVFVRSTTQPTGDASSNQPQNIRVVLDDPAQPSAATASTPLVSTMVGQKVRVQFRRDALGLVADAPTSPLNEGLPRRPVYLDGTLKQVGSDGAILDAESRSIWIPWESVLLIESPHD